MVPVARVVIETFLQDADFLAENTLLETTLLLLARDAADTDKTEEAIFIIRAMCVSKSYKLLLQQQICDVLRARNSSLKSASEREREREQRERERKRVKIDVTLFFFRFSSLCFCSLFFAFWEGRTKTEILFWSRLSETRSFFLLRRVRTWGSSALATLTEEKNKERLNVIII